MSHLRILFISPTGTLQSGGEKSNFQLIKYLKDRGHEVMIITSRSGDYTATLKGNGIQSSPGDYNWWSDSKWDNPEYVAGRNMKAVHLIYQKIAIFRPDVVVTNTLHIPWGALAAAMHNIPHVWISREFTEGSFAYLDTKMDFILGYSNKVAANSQELAKYLENKYSQKIDFFYSYVDSTNLKLKTAGKDDPIRIIVPNYINSRKNQIELVKAAGLIRKRQKYLNTQILFIGGADQYYINDLRAQIKKEDIGDKVAFLGHSDDPWSLITRNDILVQTSLSESIGRTTTEAMKLGVPVIASDIPGHREADRLGGLTLYESGDVKQLAERIIFTISNIEKARHDAERVKSVVMKTMSESECCEPFLKTLESVIGLDNPRKELRHIAPYILKVVKENGSLEKSVKKLDRDITNTLEALDDLRNSTSYRLGRKQADMIQKIRDVMPIKGSKQ